MLKKILSVALLSLLALPALAQRPPPPPPSRNHRQPPPPPPPRQLPHNALQSQYWEIGHPRTVEIYVAGPVGGRAQIREDGRLLKDEKIPFSFESRERKRESFNVTIQQADGAYWQGDVQLRPGQRVNLWIGGRPASVKPPRQLPANAIQYQNWGIANPKYVELHVAGPAGGRAQIYEDGKLLKDAAIPFTFESRERRLETFHVVIQQKDGAFWRGDVKLMPGQRINMWLGSKPAAVRPPPPHRPPAPPPSPSHRPPPPPPQRR
ncbi:MAG: hypothetical protein LBM75_07270 [Myxococcales bacterium]|jgi:hypothetical protein|nr:hypothetical protein [Myxococcales bacterium]